MPDEARCVAERTQRSRSNVEEEPQARNLGEWLQWALARKRAHSNARPEEARACFELAVQKQPDFFDGLMDLADALSIANEHESAIANYQRAMKLQPKAVRNRSRVLLAIALSCDALAARHTACI